MATTTKKKLTKPKRTPIEYALVLRTCAADMTAYDGFVWPKKGIVTAPDFKPTYKCGHGLHGLLWGEGSAGYLSDAPDAKWLVIKVDAAKVLHGKDDLLDKCKFESGEVVFCGERKKAIAYIQANGGEGKKIVFGTATAGYRGTATAGYRGTATAGDGGTATAGYGGTATAGDRGTATAGDGGTATAGDGGTATAGYRGTATAGDRGTATAGDRGTATAGDRGTATAGDRGTATAGYRGTATAGDRGTATAGDRGVISIEYFDHAKSAYRRYVGIAGENGIKPNVQYQVIDCKLIEVKDGAK